MLAWTNYGIKNDDDDDNDDDSAPTKLYGQIVLVNFLQNYAKFMVLMRVSD